MQKLLVDADYYNLSRVTLELRERVSFALRKYRARELRLYNTGYTFRYIEIR